ncbi:hypothetical protein N8T08_001886 [Aspergillus melleus]|uniref:Uncharacterized protein n=1 Tax=Aspergillus melleus TaxID=138277 RepID=A0ACC3B9T5_9EURO|nr:hypothetical protein N8T08_001886 [Aspergillus melleus]
MASPLGPQEAEKAAGEADDAHIPIQAEKENDGSVEKKGQNGVFSFGDTKLNILEWIAFGAAIVSGVALALVNLVMGNFLTLLSNFSFSDADSIPENFMPAVRNSALQFVYIGIARLVATYIYASLSTYVGYRLTRNVRQSYLRAAFSQEIAYYDRDVSGSISQQATTNGKLIQSGIAEKFGIVIQAISTFVAAFVIAFVSQWKLTLILIFMVPLLLIVLGTAGGIDAKIETTILQVYTQASSYAENVLAGVRTLQAFSLRPRVMAKYDTYLQDAYTKGMKKNKLYGIVFGGQYFVVYAGMGLAFWQGIAMLDRGEISDLGTVFTVLFSVIMAANTVMQVTPHMATFSRAATAASELFALIDRQSEINPFNDSGDKPQETAGVIDLHGISFSYPTRPDVTVLEDFTLNISAGKVTALVGPSGSGKSTIIGLLERWYNPIAGSIFLDRKDISQINLQWLRTNVRLVQQEPVLFNGSVFENIANGLVGTQWESASQDDQMQRVHEAAKLAFAHDFIQNLPQGYNTRIGERGGLLSGGQKQRIAIARSVISEPKILLLDEATSALDPHAEAIVQKALDSASANRTTIVIAHKLATIRNADNIVVMSKGKIMEQGRHEELVSRNGIYATLVKAQDLAPTNAERSYGSQDTSMEDQASEAGDDLEPLVKIRTAEAKRLAARKDREDHDLYEKTGIIRNIWKLLRATPEIWLWFGVTVATCIGGAAVNPGQALLLGNILSVFTSSDMVARGNFVALIFFVMSLGILVIYFIMGWSTNTIAQTLSRKMRREILDFFLKQDLQFFDRPENRVGALISRLDSYPQAILELMGFMVAIILMSAINIVASSILAIAVSWKLGLVGVFAGLPPMLLGGYARVKLETKMDDEMGQRLSASASVASESIMAIRTVSSLAIENTVLKKYVDELDLAISQTSGPMFHMMIWFSLTQSVEYFVLALGFWWGSKLINDGEISFYQFTVSFMSVYFSGQATALAFSFASSFTKANQAANYYFWLDELQGTISEGTDENRKEGPAYGCRSYDFQDVHFSYPLAPNTQVLKNVSLSIHHGTFIAFVGASGCGKSSMISLLERFYDPTTGSITIDSSVPLSSLNPLLYRRQVSIVQQEPTLFPGTIRENILLGVSDLPSLEKMSSPLSSASSSPSSEDKGQEEEEEEEEKLKEACLSANVWDFITSLPEGLDTPCGGNHLLSGGQRQRIAIARALIRQPRVLLLDEATSALDTESEKRVQKALMEPVSSRDRITITVAHRLSTVRDADCIFVFYAGEVLEVGGHDELVARGGMYAKMCEAQRLDDPGV